MADSDDAVTSFQGGQGMNCAQAIASTYGPRYGLDRGQALRVALAFGGGMGRMGATCGAVTGAFMVLGLKYGAGSEPGREKKEKTYAAVKRFSGEFKARNGSLLCRDLIGLDLNTPDGAKKAHETDAIRSKCPRYVKDAAEILREILEE
jgi:C_GCAxxG_C_C family probable redox protein